MLLLLSAAGHATWSDGENTLNVADYVSKFGIASMAVRPGGLWYTHQPVALVENIDLILYAGKYFEKVDFQGSVIYYSGWLSASFLDWLTETCRAPSYVLFADYDLVGIKNYLLAKKRLGNSVSMYIPDNIEELLKHGKTLDTQSDRQMIESSEDPDAIRLYRLMLETSRVLDQESILLM